MRSAPKTQPLPVLSFCHRETLNSSRFAVDTRGAKGLVYPPATIHSLLGGSQRHMLSLNPAAARLLDKKNPSLKELHRTLDNLFHRLHEEGVGQQVKHAEVITKEDEVHLWESGKLGKKDLSW